MELALERMTLHCGETEYERLVRAVARLGSDEADEADAADATALVGEACALASRYLANIGDLAPAQRAMLRGVQALAAADDAEHACALAYTAFRSVLRAVARAGGGDNGGDGDDGGGDGGDGANAEAKVKAKAKGKAKAKAVPPVRKGSGLALRRCATRTSRPY
jgi:hypothetical protein